MVFEFRAHKPNAYGWFIVLLLAVVILNILLIQSLHSVLLDWNRWVLNSIVLIIPWILFLFLPSILGGIAIYNSLMRRYRLVLQPSYLHVERLNSGKTGAEVLKEYEWSELKEFHFTDFEDNKYFRLIFKDPKNDIIIHRDTGDFETFFEELKKFLK